MRAGLFIVATGLGATALADSPSLTFLSLLPGFILVGMGIGFAGSQLNNVILSDVPPERSGAASGANTTIRMIGASLGIAVISALLTHSTSSASAHALHEAIDRAVVSGTRTPLIFATVVVYFAFALSLLIPQVGPRGSRQGDPTDDDFELLMLESELTGEPAAIV